MLVLGIEQYIIKYSSTIVFTKCIIEYPCNLLKLATVESYFQHLICRYVLLIVTAWDFQIWLNEEVLEKIYTIMNCKKKIMTVDNSNRSVIQLHVTIKGYITMTPFRVRRFCY